MAASIEAQDRSVPSEAPKRDVCCGSYEHLWVIRYARGHEQVHCARCQCCLGFETMLRAYVKLYGGEVRRGG
jgi:hypothetical protein